MEGMQIKNSATATEGKGQILARNAGEKHSQGISARVEKTELQSGAFFSQAAEENPLLIFPDRHSLKG